MSALIALRGGPSRHARALRDALRRQGLRLARFGLVGAVGVAVNTALLVPLVEVGGWDRLLAGAAATEGALLGNFALNDRWTFGDARTSLPWTHRLARYHAVALGGLAISVATLALTLRVSGLHYTVANFGAIGAGIVWNYALNARFTWGRRGARRSGARTEPFAVALADRGPRGHVEEGAPS